MSCLGLFPRVVVARQFVEWQCCVPPHPYSEYASGFLRFVRMFFKRVFNRDEGLLLFWSMYHPT